MPVLLAGASQLLDSEGANFDCRIQDALAEILSVEARNHEEAEQITSVMRDMGMVGRSMAMMDVFRSVIRFSALSDLPVLIVGETGQVRKVSRVLSIGWIRNEKKGRLSQLIVAQSPPPWRKASFSDTAGVRLRAPIVSAKV